MLSAMEQTNNGAGLMRVIAASSVGTLIEWYDFYLYGAMAPIIAARFFPASNPTAAFLAALATFAAGFVVRPFGALFFGRLGDIIGRKHTFLLTLLLMGFSTFAIGLVPGYASIGLWAPGFILLLRLLQGLALGGEYGGAATYVAEHAPEHRRGYYTSYIQTTATLGFLLSLGVILTIRQSTGVEAFEAWGWRLPFLLSAVLVGLSVYIRLSMKESPLFNRIKLEGKLSANPLRESFGRRRNLKWVLLALFGAVMGQGVVWYTGQFYAQTFIERTCSVEFEQTRFLLCLAILMATPFFLLFGHWSDRIGRKPIMLAGMLLAVVTYRPIYSAMYAICDTRLKTEVGENRNVEGKLILPQEGQTAITNTFIHYSDGSTLLIREPAKKPYATHLQTRTLWLSASGFWRMTGLVFLQILYVTMVYGPIAAFLVELFPTRIRYTSMSLPYHIGNGIFGGLTPFIATRLVEASKTTGQVVDPLVGLGYPIGIAATCFVIGLIYLPNKWKNNEQTP